MTKPAFQEKSFVDFLAAPLTVVPLGAGISVLIVAWVFPQQKTFLLFLGVLGILVGVGFLMTQWLFASEDRELAGMRQEFAASLEAVSRMDPQVYPQEAKLTTSPAPAESS